MQIINNQIDHQIVLRQIANAELLTIDIESSGRRDDPLGKKLSLSPHHNKFIGLGVKVDNKPAVYYPMKHRGYAHNWNSKRLVEDLRPFLETKKIIAHNAKYEHAMFWHHYGVDLNLFFDPMIAHYLLHAKPPHALKFLGHTLLNYSRWDFPWEDYEYSDLAPVEKMSPYCCMDCDITYELYTLFNPTIESDFSYVFHKVEMPAIKGFAEMELNGITLDKQALLKICHRLMHYIARLSLQIEKVAGYRFNIKSGPQLAKFLFEDLAIPYEKSTNEYDPKTQTWMTVMCAMQKTKSGRLKTDKHVLAAIKDAHPIVHVLMEYSHLAALYKSFMDYNNDPKTGRIHPGFNQIGAETGRSSSSKFNFQNIPTDADFNIRNCFLAPPGHLLQDADYSGQELNLLTALSGDKALMDIYKKRLDPHGFMCVHWVYPDELKGVNPNDVKKLFKEKRDIVKPLFFAKTYGAYPAKLGAMVGKDKREGEILSERYSKLFPRVHSFRENAIRFVKQNGYIVNIDGRIRRFRFACMSTVERKNYPNVFKLIEKECGDAVNMLIQGVAGSMIKQAIARLRKFRLKYKIPLKILATVHDELITETPKEYAEEACKLVEKAMRGIPISKLWNNTVIIDAKATSAKRWGDFKK